MWWAEAEEPDPNMALGEPARPRCLQPWGCASLRQGLLSPRPARDRRGRAVSTPQADPRRLPGLALTRGGAGRCCPPTAAGRETPPRRQGGRRAAGPGGSAMAEKCDVVVVGGGISGGSGGPGSRQRPGGDELSPGGRSPGCGGDGGAGTPPPRELGAARCRWGRGAALVPRLTGPYL